jgi:hypothetical protein
MLLLLKPIEKMKTELRNLHPDATVIDDRMTCTAADREQLIKQTGILDILETYPALRLERQVRQQSKLV